MKKETFYKLAIITLLVLNILQVVGRFLAHKPPGDPIKMAAQRLSLDESQEIQFRELAKTHRNQMINLQNKQEKLTETYFINPSDYLLNKITRIEKTKILITKQHFTDIKSILEVDQYKEFEKFKKNALNKIID